MRVTDKNLIVDGAPYAAGTPISRLPEPYRVSVEQNHSIDVPDLPPVSNMPLVEETTADDTSTVSTETTTETTTPTEPTPAAEEPPTETTSSSTPLPDTLTEELRNLLSAAGICDLEAAQKHFAANKSFRTIAGVTKARNTEIRKALGL